MRSHPTPSTTGARQARTQWAGARARHGSHAGLATATAAAGRHPTRGRARRRPGRREAPSLPSPTSAKRAQPRWGPSARGPLGGASGKGPPLQRQWQNRRAGWAPPTARVAGGQPAATAAAAAEAAVHPKAPRLGSACRWRLSFDANASRRVCRVSARAPLPPPTRPIAAVVWRAVGGGVDDEASLPRWFSLPLWAISTGPRQERVPRIGVTGGCTLPPQPRNRRPRRRDRSGCWQGLGGRGRTTFVVTHQALRNSVRTTAYSLGPL